MRTWKLEDAKAKLSALVNATANEGPQIISKRGVETAVVVSFEEWRRLNEKRSGSKTIIDVLLAPEPKIDIEIPDRKSQRISYDASWLDDE